MNILQEHRCCLDNVEAERLINILKAYDKDLHWTKSNNTLWRTIEFKPLDKAELQGTIPGVTVQIQFKYFKRIQEKGKTVLTLYCLKNQEKLRGYQLETNDENKVTSHNGRHIIYGNHEHIGKQVNKLPAHFAIEDIENWFKYFCNKILLDFTGEPLQPPKE